MNTNLNQKSNQQAALSALINVHSQFQEELDYITACNNDPENIEGLISIRQFNIDCISRYSAMIVKQFYTEPSKNKLKFFRNIAGDEYLWTINSQLSKIISAYSTTIIESELSDFNRMIIARNLEKLVVIKEELLHPITDKQLA